MSGDEGGGREEEENKFWEGVNRHCVVSRRRSSGAGMQLGLQFTLGSGRFCCLRNRVEERLSPRTQACVENWCN